MAIVEFLNTPAGARRRFSVKSPVDFAPLGEYECADAEDIARALAKARAAQQQWVAVPVADRAQAMMRVRDQILKSQDEIVAVVIRETGKCLAEALSMEVYSTLDSMSYYSRRAEKIMKPRRVPLHGPMAMMKKMMVVPRPLGVVGVITPWNGPFVLSMAYTVQALLAGNAVLLKGSEVTPASTLMVEQVFRAGGFPDGLLQVITGDGLTGAALVESGVNKISFTGSTATGRKIGEMCGRLLIPCSLELGGTDAMIVCDDADVDNAAAGALMGACMNAGQVCIGTQRILATPGIYDALTERIAAQCRALRQGSAFGAEEDVGPIIMDRQLTIVERHVEDAIAKGARLLAGGRRNPHLPGLYFEPTVLADCTADMLVMREETFGPVVAIRKVANEEEALTIANDSPNGLAGNVWSRNEQKAFDLACRMETGSVSVNDMSLTFGLPEAPFGGRKASGVGQGNGADGLLNYCHMMPVISNRFGNAKPSSYPYTAKHVEGLRKAITFFWGSPLGRFFQ